MRPTGRQWRILALAIVLLVSLPSIDLVPKSGGTGSIPSADAGLFATPFRNSFGGAGPWTNITLPSGWQPSERNGSAMTYDAADGVVVLFGGLSPNGTILADTWTYLAGRWTDLNLTPSASPPARAFASSVYDEADGYVLLFGGLDRSVASNAAKLNDTWEFQGGSWTQLSAVHAPLRRFAASMAYDPADGYVLLFGGNSTNGPSDDCWTFLGGVWTQLMINTPTPRSGAAMVYSPGAAGGVVMMGGVGLYSDNSKPLNWTWKYLGGTWSHSKSTTNSIHPLERFGAVLAANANSTVLVGGMERLLGGRTAEPFYFHGFYYDYDKTFWADWKSQLESGASRAPPVNLPDQFPGFVWDAADAYFLFVFDGVTWVLGVGEHLSGSISVSPSAPFVGAVVSFRANVTGGTDRFFANWSFGDGSVQNTSLETSHRFLAPGNYSVGFRAADATGRDWITFTRIEVRTPPPLSLELSPSSANLTVGESGAFSAAASGGVAPYTFAWSFGDGATEVGVTGDASHAFLQPGAYVVQCLANDSGLVSVLRTTNVTVAFIPLPFTVAIESNRTSGPAPLAVTLSAVTSNGTAPAGYAWSFGDGSAQESTPVVAHTFVQDGTYHVQATVRDVAGDAVTGAITIVVAASSGISPPVPALRVQLGVLASSNEAGAPVTFDALAVGGIAPYSYTWAGAPSACPALNSSELACRLPDFGTLVVAVTVGDMSGGVATSVASISVEPSTQTPPPTQTTPSPPVSPPTRPFAPILLMSPIAVPIVVWILLGIVLGLSASVIAVAAWSNLRRKIRAP